MPIARVELPNGRIGRFEVPEGTTPEQAQQVALQEWERMQSEQPTQEAPQQTAIAEPETAIAEPTRRRGGGLPMIYGNTRCPLPLAFMVRTMMWFMSHPMVFWILSRVSTPIPIIPPVAYRIML